MDCSLQAKFGYIDKIPQSSGSAAVYGSAVHEAIDSYHKGKTLDEAVEVFRDYMNNNEPDYWNRMTSFTSYMDQGPKMIADYIDQRKWSTTDVVASEFRFMVPFGEHQISGIVDILELSHDHSLMKIVDLKTGKRPIMDALHLNIQFCVDPSTEILTRRGWKTYNELTIGEEVLTINHETGEGEWQPLIDVHTFDAVNQELVSFEGYGHSSLTTKNHRWPVIHTISSKKGWRKEKRFKESDELYCDDRIIGSALVKNLPFDSLYSDELVELLAWIWTEGNLRQDGTFCFSQSETVNLENVLRIRQLLEKIYGPESESLRGKIYSTWRESKDSDCSRFYLNKSASEDLYKYFYNMKLKIIDYNFINSLTFKQLHLFIDTSILADGSEQNYRVITQKEKARLDVLQMACSLVGIRTSLTKENIKSNGDYNGWEFWRLSLKEKDNLYVPSKKKKQYVNYTGIVWCPRTQNQTWYARRNGQVYFTGNTIYEWASHQKEFWCGHPDEPEKYAGFENGEELYEHYKSIERKAYWYDLKKQEEIYVGPRSMKDYARLYRVCEQVARAVEHEVFVPAINENTCVWCPYQDICPMYFNADE